MDMDKTIMRFVQQKELEFDVSDDKYSRIWDKVNKRIENEKSSKFIQYCSNFYYYNKIKTAMVFVICTAIVVPAILITYHVNYGNHESSIIAINSLQKGILI